MAVVQRDDYALCGDGVISQHLLIVSVYRSVTWSCVAHVHTSINVKPCVQRVLVIRCPNTLRIDEYIVFPLTLIYHPHTCPKKHREKYSQPHSHPLLYATTSHLTFHTSTWPPPPYTHGYGTTSSASYYPAGAPAFARICTSARRFLACRHCPHHHHGA